MCTLPDTDKSRLVVTPTPKLGESYMSFILRTAEMNGYTVNIMLRHGGLSENEIRSARPPIARIAHLYGRDVGDFAVLGDVTTETGRYLPLMGHDLPAIYLRSKHARVCPQCVQEMGMVEAFWELRHAVACPTHGRMALCHCPKCHREIDWWRKGITKCSCGHDFAQWTGEVLEDARALALLSLLKAKLVGDAIDHVVLAELGFPVAHLENMSLSSLLNIMNKLEAFIPATTNIDFEGLTTAAHILSDWPNNFHDYLEEVHAPQANLQLNGLRGQFLSFYEAIFKVGPPKDEVEFMHKEFVAFGERRWKKASIHPRLKPANTSHIVGIYGLAKAMGIMPSTARKLVAKGAIPVHSRSGKNGRLLFDLSGQMTMDFAKAEG